MVFLPAREKFKGQYRAIFTHGYTASKSDVLTWAARFADEGHSSIIFDLPGHLLGSYNKVKSFEEFTTYAPDLFWQANELLAKVEGEHGVLTKDASLILGGHSLGALLALHSIKNKKIAEIPKKYFVAVGFGLNQDVKTHLFDTDFYAKTLNIRRQLVVSEIDSDVMFPWIRNEKLEIEMTGQKILLITGEDDAVVGKGGVDALFNMLSPFNQVEVLKPAKLPHHQPELAATHVFNYFKKLETR